MTLDSANKRQVNITLPYNYACRWYQIEMWEQFQKGIRRFVRVWHRRAGKDKDSWNFMIKEAAKKAGVYYYFFPHFSQGRKILWDGMDKTGFRFLNHIPIELIKGKPNSTEMKVRLQNDSLIQIIGTNNIDCYDDKTEVLTRDGWKLFAYLCEDDEVATFEGGFLRFTKPSRKISFFYEGEMISFKNASNDLLVTPNHKFFTHSKKGGYKLKTYDQISIRNDRIPSNSVWEGEEKEEFEFPVIENEWETGKGRQYHKIWNRKLPTEDFVALLGIFLSEGSTYRDKKTYRITITQKKEETKKEIIDLLDRCGINYNINQNNISFEDKQLCIYFSQFGLSHERYIPKDIKNLSPKYLQILFDWMVKGGGSVQRKKTSYYSTSKRLVDDFQEVAIKLGKNGYVTIKPQKKAIIADRIVDNFRTLYVCYVSTSKWKSFANNKISYLSKQNYSGNVYCVTVPSGVIKVRRNGMECWCGNSIVGTNPIGCVFSEFSLQDPTAWTLIRPILRENGGWAMFNFTPRGANHAKDLADMARGNPEWHFQLLTVEDTKIISPAEIQKERDEGMSEDMIQQEFYCSFTLGVEGSYYAKYLQDARDEERIGNVPYDTQKQVCTAWDIGYGDSTAIIFYQVCGQEIHIIDYYENHGEGLSHYVKVLRDKPYIYSDHFAPHDIESHSFSSGLSPKEVASELGIRFITLPTLKITLESGIEAVRGLFPRIWIDEGKCKQLIKCLENYRKEFDQLNQVYRSRPVHNYASHGADAARYLSLAVKLHVDAGKAGVDDKQADRWYAEAHPNFG